MRTLIAGLAVGLLALGLAACGDDDDSTVGSGASTTTAADGGSSTTADDSGGKEENTVAVTASGFKFSPATATAKAGEVYFEITNDDDTNHTFTIDDADVDIKVDGMSTGEDEADLEAGTYEWRCTIHSSMTGTLTVS
jgi:plastocyanin